MKLFLKSDITTKKVSAMVTFHVHVHNTPGVEHHGQADKFVIKPGHPLYEKYKKLFKGVKQ